MFNPMKKSLFTLVLALVAATTTAFGQAAKATDPKVEAQLIALEKAGWEAWKKNDAVWFEANLAPDFTTVDGTPKAVFIKKVMSCQVESYSLGDIRVRMLDDNAALLTYSVSQHAVCGGTAAPVTVQATSNVVRRGGQWLAAFHMERPVSK